MSKRGKHSRGKEKGRLYRRLAQAQQADRTLPDQYPAPVSNAFAEAWDLLNTADDNPPRLGKAIESLTSALEKVGVSPDLRQQLAEPLEGFLRAWLRKAKDNVHMMNEGTLFVAAHSLAVVERSHFLPNNIQNDILNSPNLEYFFRDWFERAKKLLPETSEQHLAMSLYNLGVLGIRPPVSFLDAWYRTTERKLTSFRGDQLGASLYGLATLGISPPQAFLRAWLSASEEKKETFDAQAAAMSVFSMAIFRSLGADIAPQSVRPLFDRYKALVKNEPSIKKDYGAFALAALTFFPEEAALIRHDALSQTLDVESSVSQERFVSALRQAIASSGWRNRISITENPYFARTVSNIDFVVHIDDVNGKETAHYLQIDGPFHYTRGEDGEKLNGSTQLQNYLFRQGKKEGEFFTRVPYHSLEYDFENTVKTTFARTLSDHEKAPKGLEKSGADWKKREAARGRSGAPKERS